VWLVAPLSEMDSEHLMTENCEKRLPIIFELRVFSLSQSAQVPFKRRQKRKPIPRKHPQKNGVLACELFCNMLQ